jgi:hypothetical protein
MAIPAFAAPFGVRDLRLWRRKAPLALLGAVWTTTIAILFAAWLASPAQRTACDAPGRGARACAPTFAASDPDCEGLGRGGRICIRGR